MLSKNFLNHTFGLDFEALYERDGLIKLDQKFSEFLAKKNPETAQNFCELKANPVDFLPKKKSAILIDVARVLEDFLAEIFCIEKENYALRKQHEDLKKIYQIRREFVQRIVAKKFSSDGDEVANINGFQLLEELKIPYFDVDELEKNLAEKISEFLTREKNLNDEEKNQLEILTLYSAWALYSHNGKQLHRDGALFILPQKIDHQNLVTLTPTLSPQGRGSCSELGIATSPLRGEGENHPSTREGFDLTDKGFALNRSLAEAHYCIFCHNQEKDSCRSGLKEKSTSFDKLRMTEELEMTEEFKKDSLGIELHGCPLDEKISEMNFLKSEGFSIAALATACIDNPMIAGTGHRICNDCMKSCIFQKQDAVDIPQVETRVLKDVLALPYGFEIYSLLTRWNPLNIERTLPQKNTGKKILICGLGPAGYTLAHHLLNDGHVVVAIDGLKIEPLNPQISGIDEFGNRQKFKPIKFLDEIYEPLSSRLIQGFGGVAEYGITVRFDKNFLKIIRLILERRKNFRMFGGIRFGSSITDKIAFENYGFDHVALCIGAGRPNIINIKNNFAKGIRSASDFLMSLQLSGSFKEELFTNLQIRMPIIVIGGGLTAVDAACEAAAYYFVQIKKFAKKTAKIGKEKIWKILNEEEKIIAEEFLQHALELAESRLDRNQLLQKWGGVKILYRKKIQDSPAYRLNHQELSKAFAEGIEFVENLAPLEAKLDSFGHIQALKCADEKIFPCKSLIIAAGTTPNISPVLEDGLDFQLDGKYFAEIFADKKLHEINRSPKPKQFSVITKIDKNSGKAVSFFGDLHPDFEGNVVKAMASAKLGYKQISEILLRDKYQKFHPDHSTNSGIEEPDEFLQKISASFLVKIKKIEKLSQHVFEVFVKAPLLAQQTQIGQIFRLQNYHALAKKIDDQLLAMEGVAITALNIDKKNGIISGIVVATGGSTSLIKNFKAGEPCIFMGPSGRPTEIPKNKNVVLIGGGRGNQVLAAISEAYKQNGCHVTFFVGYRKNSEIIRQKKMENSCDVFVCAVEEERPKLILKRAQDQQFQGTVIEAMCEYFLKNPRKIDHIFTIGNDRMMAEVAKLRHENRIESLANAPLAISSLNAPMQCMLKGVCAQCLQKKVNEKGEEEFFYSCANQDQNIDQLDFQHLHWRCEQNSLSEKITKLWIECLDKASSADELELV